MTSKEATYSAPSAQYRTSAGDNLNKVCYRIYGKVTEELKSAITKVNLRLDWENIQPNVAILYYKESVMKQIV